MTDVLAPKASMVAGFGAEMLAELWQVAALVLGPRPPEPGERAIGHGVSGAVVSVPEQQPLAADNVWRVTLADEGFGRLVGRARDGAWQLLPLDELTDAQLEAYETAMGGGGGSAQQRQVLLLQTSTVTTAS